MNANPPRALIGALFFSLLCGVSLLPARVAAQGSQQGVEELTRGPVHEAFATSVSYEPEVGMTVDRQPPELIDELPPDQRPTGENVSWIPGYWAWDDDRTDFIWISGIWRNLPPGRQWVPGYWNASGSSWQWVSGYWADGANEEVTYLPAPPKALENGPNIDPPSANHVWISGNWMYNDSRYAWRPGYWEPAQENWVWVPGHHVWTPGGYVYVDGYWDYEVERRGMVFAPVHFDRVVYSRPDYYYTPATVIITNVFLSHLFVRPGYGHYYFGDYYSPHYRDRGWFASFHYHGSRRGYDPIFVHDRWRHRGDNAWEQRRRDNFDFYRNNEGARPPHTWSDMMRRPENERRGRRDNFNFASPLNRFVSNREENRGVRFQALDKGARDRIVSQRQDMRSFGRDRQQLDIRGGRDRRGPDKAGSVPSVIREKLQRSPVVAKRLEQLTGKDAPPPRRTSQAPGRDTPGRDAPGRDDRGTRGGPPTAGPRDPATPGDPRRSEPGRDSTPGGRPGVMPERRPQVTPPDDKRAERPDRPIVPTPGMKREPGTRVVPEPQRRSEPEKARVIPRPQRQEETPRRAEPQRPSPTPQRQMVPQRKAEPERKTPAPQRQAVPQRRAEPQRQSPAPQRQAVPQRRAEPQRQAPAPQRQAVPQRRAEPQRQAPQRQATPSRPEVKPQAPQSRPQARPQAPSGGGRPEGRRGRD